MQILMVSNMMYALVLPVIEIFVAAYVMRNSQAVAKVVTYQLSIYAATPLAFYINGKLLGRLLIPGGHTTNIAWGDDDWCSLYMTTYHSVYRTRLSIPGVPVW